MKEINLKELGLTGKLLREAEDFPGYYIGRVFSQHKNLYRVMCESGEISAQVSGKFRFAAEEQEEFPAVGDFVALDRDMDKSGNAVIHGVLKRKSAFVRKAVGGGQGTQVVASNIDTVFLCMALNSDFNLRRLERYLSLAWDSGATPVVVLTKADLCGDLNQKVSEVHTVAVGVDVLVTSGVTEGGYEGVERHLAPGQTVAFMGSSGVGKSTLVNRLLGEERMATSGLRDDDRGRHTTTHRQLVVLEGGAMVIDTPGMRELGVEGGDFSNTFSDIDTLAQGCKFSDCSHGSEPGCAVQEAIAEGRLSPQRFANYKKLQREAGYEGLSARQIEEKKLNEMFKGAGEMKNARKFLKEKNKRR